LAIIRPHQRVDPSIAAAATNFPEALRDQALATECTHGYILWQRLRQPSDPAEVDNIPG
jgi:hypothetical protein